MYICFCMLKNVEGREQQETGLDFEFSGTLNHEIYSLVLDRVYISPVHFCMPSHSFGSLFLTELNGLVVREFLFIRLRIHQS